MPELPDITIYIEQLEARIAGKALERETIKGNRPAALTRMAPR